jgi:hypothetical protein
MATSKTVSSVSKSNKSNTNKSNYTYLVFSVTANGIIEDDMLWDYKGDTPLEKILQEMRESWDELDLKRVRIVKIKNSEIKGIKQTLELINLVGT